jgi:hypothetical protein
LCNLFVDLRDTFVMFGYDLLDPQCFNSRYGIIGSQDRQEGRSHLGWEMSQVMVLKRVQNRSPQVVYIEARFAAPSDT